MKNTSLNKAFIIAILPGVFACTNPLEQGSSNNNDTNTATSQNTEREEVSTPAPGKSFGFC